MWKWHNGSVWNVNVALHTMYSMDYIASKSIYYSVSEADRVFVQLEKARIIHKSTFVLFLKTGAQTPLAKILRNAQLEKFSPGNISSNSKIYSDHYGNRLIWNSPVWISKLCNCHALNEIIFSIKLVWIFNYLPGMGFFLYFNDFVWNK